SDISEELLENADTKEALEICTKLTEEEQREYDSFWDLESLNLDREETVKEIARTEARAEGLAKGRAEGLVKGRAEGLVKGRAEGRAEGLAEGAKQKSVDMARMMKAGNEPLEKIIRYIGLTSEEISNL
ncbi:MAG: hypothetical protein II937_17140, partial [Bacteroidales bacterium]|nr:hypothetical protein [Bacteroidales bacterium]